MAGQLRRNLITVQWFAAVTISAMKLGVAQAYSQAGQVRWDLNNNCVNNLTIWILHDIFSELLSIQIRPLHSNDADTCNLLLFSAFVMMFGYTIMHCLRKKI